jgi:hypothetical protein
MGASALQSSTIAVSAPTCFGEVLPASKPCCSSSGRASMTGADAIAQVLRDAGHAMRAAEIAREVNRRRLYQRWDSAPLPAYQVASIVHGQRRRFRIDKGLIALGWSSRTCSWTPTGCAKGLRRASSRT